MDSIVANCSQKSKQSQNSFDWSEFDDVLDLDQSPTFNSSICSLEITNYPSQLILSRGTQRNKSKIDSGFDVESTSSTSSTFTSQTSQVSFEGHKRISNHSLSLAPSSVGSSDVDSGCASSPVACTLPSKKSRLESPLPILFSSQNTSSLDVNTFRSPIKPATLTRLPFRETDESNDSETPESVNYHANATVSHDCDDDSNGNSNDAASQQQSMSLSNPIHLKIAPILNLMSQIKTQYSDYAFVYALAAHMCKDIYPRDCHISLKTALLLSIVSCNVKIPLYFSKNTFIMIVHSLFIYLFLQKFHSGTK